MPASLMSRPPRSVTVLGKRKTRDALVLHVSASSDAASDSEYAPAASPVLATGKSIAGPSKASALSVGEEPSVKARNSQKVYKCTYEGCQKAYTKPSKLEEHQRSHRGEVCSLSDYNTTVC